jgi:hypothetical protein
LVVVDFFLLSFNSNFWLFWVPLIVYKNYFGF